MSELAVALDKVCLTMRPRKALGRISGPGIQPHDFCLWSCACRRLGDVATCRFIRHAGCSRIELGDIDIETCGECGGPVKVMPKALAALAGQALACIEHPVVIEKILTHLQEKLTSAPAGLRPASRVPPADLFG